MRYFQKFQASAAFRLKVVYTVVLYCSGIAIISSFLFISFSEFDWALVLGVAIFYGVLDYFASYLEIERQDKPGYYKIYIGIIEAPSFFAIVVLGPSGILSVVLATLIVYHFLFHSKWLNVFDGIANRSIVYCVVLAFYSLFPVSSIPFTTVIGIISFIGMVVLYLLVDIVTSILQRAVLFYRPFWEILKSEPHETYLFMMIAATMGSLASILWYVQPLLVLLVILPLFLAQRAILAIVKQEAAHAQMREIAQAKEQAEAASRFKSQFISMVSHDLRTPLNAIINYAQFLSKPRYGGLTERQQDIQQRLLVNATQLLTLVNNLLDRAKIESGHIQYQPMVVDLPLLVQECVDSLQSLADKKGLPLQVNFTGTVLYSWCDPKLVQQVVLNLLSNAIKFTSQGGVTVRVEQDSDRQVVIAVSDTGIGIAPEQYDHIFDEFHQIPNPDMLQQHGSGLGLAICKRLVELQDGAMWFESEVGSGSTFYVRLPVPMYEEVATSPSVADSADTVQS